MKLRHVVLVLMLVGQVGAVEAGRYRGTAEDAAPIKRLLVQLSTYQDKFERLLEMRVRIEQREQALNEKKARLAREAQEARDDRARVEAAEMTEQQLDAKWHSSGRSVRNQREVQAFKEEAAQFNAYIDRYNQLAKELAPYLEERSVSQLRVLVEDIERLRANLLDAIDSGDFYKAKYIARHSAVAAEFGYATQ